MDLIPKVGEKWVVYLGELRGARQVDGWWLPEEALPDGAIVTITRVYQYVNGCSVKEDRYNYPYYALKPLNNKACRLLGVIKCLK